MRRQSTGPAQLPSFSVARRSPLATSQSWTHPANPPVARVAPSGEKARLNRSTAGTSNSRCNRSILLHVADPDAMDDPLPAGSNAKPAAAMRLPSGESAKSRSSLSSTLALFHHVDRADLASAGGVPEVHEAVVLGGDGGRRRRE